MNTSKEPESVPPEVYRVITRYRSSYRVADTTVSVGKAFKVTGVILGILIIMGGGALLGESGEMGSFMMISAGIVGLITGAFFYLIGVLVAAQGQTLLAALDQAVYSSTFLSNEQRIKVMRLPGSKKLRYTPARTTEDDSRPSPA